MRSHALLRTNTGLTTNAKFVVGSNYELYLDCIDSNPELNNVRYRKFRFRKENYIDELIPHFFRNTPVEVSYGVKYDGDNDMMYNDFSKQYDDLYNCGARNIYDNKDYTEEFEYFAPLHISKSGLPTHFIIFRVDGPGLIELGRDNFRTEILSKMKVVKIFDMTPKTDLGEFLRTNITNNTNFPSTSLEIDFSKLEFSYFIGMDYETGGYTKRSVMLESVFQNEFTFMDMEKFIYKGFADNRIVYPHILNFSFLFDDTPATPTTLRKWSINRYLGFYFNKLEFVFAVSPNKFTQIKPEAIITSDNNLEMPNGSSPFLEGMDLNPYIEIEGRVYRVEKYKVIGEQKRQKVLTERGNYIDKIAPTEIIKYKILSDVSLSNKQSLINANLIKIVSEDGENFIYSQNGNQFVISDFDDYDMWIIKIGDIHHKLNKNENGFITIVSDYAFIQTDDKFQYYINESDPSFKKSIDLVSNSEIEPVEFEIYRCEFTDIKDWDTDIVDTEFSKFEYEEDQILTENDEPKFYLQNLKSLSKPKQFDDFVVDGEVVNIPVSSEYTANHETFRIVENDLNELWRKNATRVKWGFQNSLSSGDYPYLLNNSFLADDFNRTVNPFFTEVNRSEKNLDYFYTINPDNTKYTNFTLHIKNITGGGLLDTSLKFDVIKYVSTELDYFSYFFGQKTDFADGTIIKNTKKWSQFNPSDGITTNTSLFRGLKFKIYDVASVNISGGKLDKINVKVTNKFDDYKFSILLSDNQTRIVPSGDDPNRGITQSFFNSMNWTVIDDWKMDKPYYWYEMTIWNNKIFITTKPTDPELQKIGYDPILKVGTRTETDPRINPANQVEFRPSDRYWLDLATDYAKTQTTYNGWVNGPNSNFIIETPFLSQAKVRTDTAGNIGNYSNSCFPQVHPFVYYDNEWWYDSGIVGTTLPWDFIIDANGKPLGYPPRSNAYYKGKIWFPNPSAQITNTPTFSSKNVTTIPGTLGQVVIATFSLGRYKFENYPYWVESDIKMEDIRDKLLTTVGGQVINLPPTGKPWGRYLKVNLWSSSIDYKGLKTYDNRFSVGRLYPTSSGTLQYPSLVGLNVTNGSGFFTGQTADPSAGIRSRNGLTFKDQAFEIVLYKDVVYGMTGKADTVIPRNSLPPDQNPNWVRLYSLKPDKDFVYDNTFRGNSIIQMNNRYYMYLRDSSVVATPLAQAVDVVDGTLDHGIDIYINKKFKNILINIYVNDHTYDTSLLELNKDDIWPETSPTGVSKIIKLGNKLREKNRDELYTDIFQKLTANNFMNAINDLSNKYDFINSVKYIIIEETGETKIYDFDNLTAVSKLPFFITCEGPDEFFVKRDSNIVEAVETDSNLLKPRFELKDGLINSKEELNYVSDIPYANLIRYNRIEQQPVPNFSSLKNEIFNKMYRHSGFYSPIFKDIELFKAYTENDNIGNYKFDTTLTNFGMSGERIISKVNKDKNLLKLTNVSSAKSIYPMLDEFGYQVVKTFIFKSTWDFKYHYQAQIPVVSEIIGNKLIKRQEQNIKSSTRLL